MEIIKTEIVSTLMDELILSAIATLVMLALLFVAFAISCEYVKKKRRLLRGCSIAVVVLILPFGWYTSLSNIITYEKRTVVVTDWNEVHKNNWEIVETNEDEVVLKREITN